MNIQCINRSSSFNADIRYTILCSIQEYWTTAKEGNTKISRNERWRGSLSSPEYEIKHFHVRENPQIIMKWLHVWIKCKQEITNMNKKYSSDIKTSTFSLRIVILSTAILHLCSLHCDTFHYRSYTITLPSFWIVYFVFVQLFLILSFLYRKLSITNNTALT